MTPFDLAANRKTWCFLLIAVTSYGGAIAQPHFENVANSAGIDHYATYSHPWVFMSGGAAWFDYDNDGWDDLYLTGGKQPDKLYRNNQDGTFSDHSVESGIYSPADTALTLAVSAADVNRDGFVDIIVGTDHYQRNKLFMNNGNGTFSESGLAAGLLDEAFAAGVSIGDYDQDGWPDLYIANWRGKYEVGDNVPHPDRLYHNNQDGTFTDVTLSEPMWSDSSCGLASAFVDIDFDGDVDLMLANDFGDEPWALGNRVFRNDDGSFVDVSASTNFGSDMNAMGIAIGDYDEDQDFDYYITDIGDNQLLRDNGFSFSDVTYAAGVESAWNLIGQMEQQSWSWGTAFLDYDNDTYVDLFVSNGHINWTFPDENRLYRNLSASGLFEDVTVVTGMNDPLIGRGCAQADYDHDGDVDLVVVICDTLNTTGRTLLLKNDGGNTKNWLQVDLTGVASNLDAVGSVVRLYSGGRVFLRQVDSGGASYMSHHSKTLHFGLGEYSLVDSLVVTWPSGEQEQVYNIAVNQVIEITEGLGVITGVQQQNPDEVHIYPNPTQGKFTVSTGNHKPLAVRVYNAIGSEVFPESISFESGRFTASVSNLESGVYSVLVQGPHSIQWKQLIRY